MRITHFRHDYDWQELTYEQLTDLLKERKIAIKTAVIDGDKKIIKLLVTYIHNESKKKVTVFFTKKS